MTDYLRTTVQNLNGKNYSIWSEKMELLLITEDLWDLIEEEMPTPVDNLWSKRDDKARGTIVLLEEDNQLIHMQGSKIAREA